MTISSRRIEWIKKLSSISLLQNLVFGAHFCSKAFWILTNEYTKMTISSRRIEWIKKLSSIFLLQNLVFGAHFCSKASHGQCCTYGLETTLKLLVHVLAIMANSYLKIVFSQKSGLNPPAFFGFWAQNFFGGLNQKSAMISMCKIHIYIDSESFRQIH